MTICPTKSSKIGNLLTNGCVISNSYDKFIIMEELNNPIIICQREDDNTRIEVKKIKQFGLLNSNCLNCLRRANQTLANI